MHRSFVSVAFLFAAGLSALAQDSIDSKVQGAERRDGFLRYYWDARQGRIWLEIDKWNTEFLYVLSLPAGIGSNDIGLDRGQIGAERIVQFERSGPKVLLVASNYDFRSSSPEAAQQRAVKESFAQSVLWGFEIVAEEGGRALVDATPLFLRDAYDVAGTLQRTDNTTFKFDAPRSAFYLPGTRNFPKNTEIEATITLTGGPAGRHLSSVSPAPDAVTVRQHHSFIQLPEPGFRSRDFDPRAGFFGPTYMDLSAPLGAPITKRFVARHRLQKKDPGERVGEPVQPIVYYLDTAAPEPIRSALLEGARWWNQAFEAAGYINAFRVELMSEDMDPMDIRYNVIQWVHRSTRGWSYGGSVVDPRTGEIIKGKVTLGSLRARQDYLIAEALLAPYESGKPESSAMREMALARLRQLSAHEVGHTLGLAHNYIASTQGNSSVMDYPHPWVELKSDGTLDLSRSYAQGIGEWDKVAINYGYREFPRGTDEHTALSKILLDALQRRLSFLSDADARPLGSAHPLVHLWDNGGNAVDELDRWMKVRAAALSRFSENNIRVDQPLAMLGETLVPLYLSHRYQVEAASKVLGGLSYTYALRGDGQIATQKVPAEEQNRALHSLLATIQPEALALPERVLNVLAPNPHGYRRTRESFPERTGVTFDALSAAETAAGMTIGLILHPERSARLVEYHARDAASPGLATVMDELLKATWQKPPVPGLPGEIQRTVNQAVLYHLMALASNEDATSQVRAMASWKLNQLREWIEQNQGTDDAARASAFLAAAQIKRFLEDPKVIPVPKPAPPPPGMPIGDID
jgi:hypothetical protein